MRFALPEDSDSDYDVEVIEFGASSSDESDHVPDLRRRRRSKLGRTIAEYLASSDSEGQLDSEDEVGLIVDVVIPTKVAWREPSQRKGKGKAPAKPPPAPRMSRSSVSLPPAGPSWRRWEPTVGDLLRERDSPYSEWVKATEAESWRDGERAASERRQKLKAIARNHKAELMAEQARKRDAEAEEIRKMMEGLAVRQQKKEVDSAKQFAEREARLWADVNAAIRNAEKKAQEKYAQQLAAARKEKEEEEARIAAAEQAAVQRKAEAEKAAKEEAERVAKEAAEKERQAAEARKAEEDAKVQEEQKKAAAEEGSRGQTHWAKWASVQRKVKAEFIERGKADPTVMKDVRQAKRLITRSIGQVTNTKEVILRVTNDLHGHFSAQLPSPPSAAAPTSIDTMPLAYGYILSHTAKTLIKQAEEEVSARADGAFPLARVVLGLLIRGHAAFGQILFSRFVKKCPWVVPHIPTRQENQSREEYEKSHGRRSDESAATYLDRMSGITTLYFAILQTPLASIVDSSGQRPTPQELQGLIIPELRLTSAWTWMACMLRAPLVTSAFAAHLLLVFLDNAGFALLATYGPKQVSKVLAAMEKGAEAGAIKAELPASLEQLKAKIQSFKSSGRLDAPAARNWS